MLPWGWIVNIVVTNTLIIIIILAILFIFSFVSDGNVSRVEAKCVGRKIHFFSRGVEKSRSYVIFKTAAVKYHLVVHRKGLEKTVQTPTHSDWRPVG
jgi:hypothetical protein